MSATLPAVNSASGLSPARPISSSLRQAWRWPLLAGHIVKGMAITKSLGLLSDELRIAKFQADLVALCGVDVTVIGEPADEASLWACNHVSWIDAPVLGSFPRCVPVAKHEVSEWPVIGRLVKAGGAVFIKRGANQANAVRDHMAQLLAYGSNVVVYPEATTTRGNQVSYVFPRLLSAATLAQVPLQPISIRYGLADNGEMVAPYVDNMRFLPHLKRLLSEKRISCTVEFLPLIDSDQPRDVLANTLRKSLAGSLGLPASDNQKHDIDVPQLLQFLKSRHGI